MNLDAKYDADCDQLIRLVAPKWAPIFEASFSDEQKRAVYRYFFSQRPTKSPPSLKSRLINLYNPMADRRENFPDGLRLACGIFVGCSHGCGYCYVNQYSQGHGDVSSCCHAKDGFPKNLNRDLGDLANLGFPKVCLHASNSTDPFQKPLEERTRHALCFLAAVHKNRHLFTQIVNLTKNPEMLLGQEYLSLISQDSMKPYTLQVSLAFWRDEPRKFYEVASPPVESRLRAIRALREHGVEIELRFDPCFPSTRIDASIRRHRVLSDYGLPEAQTRDDIYRMAEFCNEVGVKAVILSALKVPISARAKTCKDWFGQLYLDAAGGTKRVKRGTSWRLPAQYERELIHSVADAFGEFGIPHKHCMRDVLTRK